MAPDLKTQMREYLKERYGISTYAELQERIKTAPRINLAIFQEVNVNDDQSSQGAGGTPFRAAAG